MSERTQSTLPDLIPAEWFDAPEYDGVLVAIYASSLGLAADWDAVSNVIRAFTRNHHPHMIGMMGDAKAFEAPNIDARVSYGQGERRLHYTLNNLTVPEGDYLVVAAPISTDEGGEARARETLRVVRGAAVAIFGHTAAEHMAALLSLPDRTTTRSYSPVFEQFLAPPSFGFIDIRWIDLIVARAPFLSQDRKSRFLRTLGFIERASAVVDPVSRFSNLWIALEIAASGKPDRLIKSLTVDGRKSGVLRELHLARNELFHHGREPKMSSHAERALILATLADFLTNVGVDPAEIRDSLQRIEDVAQAGPSA